MPMGVNQSVWVANDSGQDIYVIAAANPDWVIADVATDAALILVGLTELKATLTLAELPATIASFRDLYQFIKITGTLLSGSFSVGSRPAEAALAVIEAVKKHSIPISAGDAKDVKDANFLAMYLNASGIGGILGASTVSVMVMSADGKQVAMWNTGPDDSWIATREKNIVRSKYGSVWQHDPGAGSVNWPVAQAHH